MGMELPSGLRNLFYGLTGSQWFTADETRLRALSGLLDRTGDRIEVEIAPLIVSVKRRVRTTFDSRAADYFEESIDKFTAGDTDYVKAASDAAHQLGDFVREAANQVEYVKWMIIGQLIQLALEIAWAIAMSKWTFGASLSMIPVFEKIASLAIQRLLRFLFNTLLTHLVVSVTFAMVMDQLIQRLQIARGDRVGNDNDLSAAAGVGGVLDGLFSAGLSVFGGKFADWITDNFDSILKNNFKNGPGPIASPVVGKSVDTDGLPGDATPPPKSGSDHRPEGSPTPKSGPEGLGADPPAPAPKVREDPTPDPTPGGRDGAPVPPPRNNAADFGGAPPPVRTPETVPPPTSPGTRDLPETGPGAGPGNMPPRLADDMADALARHASDLARPFGRNPRPWDNVATTARFRDDVGKAFASNLGDRLGHDAARDLGRNYADTFTANWGKRDIGDSLARALDNAPTGPGGRQLSPETRAFLSQTLPDGTAKGLAEFADNWRRTAAHFGTNLGEAAGSNYLAEGFSNMILSEDHEFDANGMSAVAGAASAGVTTGGVLGGIKGLDALENLFRSNMTMDAPPPPVMESDSVGTTHDSEAPTGSGTTGGSGGSGGGGGSGGPGRVHGSEDREAPSGTPGGPDTPENADLRDPADPAQNSDVPDTDERARPAPPLDVPSSPEAPVTAGGDDDPTAAPPPGAPQGENPRGAGDPAAPSRMSADAPEPPPRPDTYDTGTGRDPAAPNRGPEPAPSRNGWDVPDTIDTGTPPPGTDDPSVSRFEDDGADTTLVDDAITDGPIDRPADVVAPTDARTPQDVGDTDAARNHPADVPVAGGGFTGAPPATTGAPPPAQSGDGTGSSRPGSGPRGDGAASQASRTQDPSAEADAESPSSDARPVRTTSDTDASPGSNRTDAQSDPDRPMPDRGPGSDPERVGSDVADGSHEGTTETSRPSPPHADLDDLGGLYDDPPAPAPAPSRTEPVDPHDPWQGNPPRGLDLEALQDPKAGKDRPRTTEELLADLTEYRYALDDVLPSSGDDTALSVNLADRFHYRRSYGDDGFADYDDGSSGQDPTEARYSQDPTSTDDDGAIFDFSPSTSPTPREGGDQQGGHPGSDGRVGQRTAPLEMGRPVRFDPPEVASAHPPAPRSAGPATDRPATAATRNPVPDVAGAPVFGPPVDHRPGDPAPRVADLPDPDQWGQESKPQVRKFSGPFAATLKPPEGAPPLTVEMNTENGPMRAQVRIHNLFFESTTREIHREGGEDGGPSSVRDVKLRILSLPARPGMDERARDNAWRALKQHVEAVFNDKFVLPRGGRQLNVSAVPVTSGPPESVHAWVYWSPVPPAADGAPAPALGPDADGRGVGEVLRRLGMLDGDPARGEDHPYVARRTLDRIETMVEPRSARRWVDPQRVEPARVHTGLADPSVWEGARAGVPVHRVGGPHVSAASADPGTDSRAARPLDIGPGGDPVDPATVVDNPDARPGDPKRFVGAEMNPRWADRKFEWARIPIPEEYRTQGGPTHVLELTFRPRIHRDEGTTTPERYEAYVREYAATLDAMWNQRFRIRGDGTVVGADGTRVHKLGDDLFGTLFGEGSIPDRDDMEVADSASGAEPPPPGSGDQLHVRLLLADDSTPDDRVHHEISLESRPDKGAMDADTWNETFPVEVGVHETAHLLGLLDEYFDSSTVFRGSRDANAVRPGDDDHGYGLMGNEWVKSDAAGRRHKRRDPVVLNGYLDTITSVVDHGTSDHTPPPRVGDLSAEVKSDIAHILEPGLGASDPRRNEVFDRFALATDRLLQGWDAGRVAEQLVTPGDAVARGAVREQVGVAADARAAARREGTLAEQARASGAEAGARAAEARAVEFEEAARAADARAVEARQHTADSGADARVTQARAAFEAEFEGWRADGRLARAMDLAGRNGARVPTSAVIEALPEAARHMIEDVLTDSHALADAPALFAAGRDRAAGLGPFTDIPAVQGRPAGTADDVRTQNDQWRHGGELIEAFGVLADNGIAVTGGEWIGALPDGPMGEVARRLWSGAHPALDGLGLDRAGLTRVVQEVFGAGFDQMVHRAPSRELTVTVPDGQRVQVSAEQVYNQLRAWRRQGTLADVLGVLRDSGVAVPDDVLARASTRRAGQRTVPVGTERPVPFEPPDVVSAHPPATARTAPPPPADHDDVLTVTFARSDAALREDDRSVIDDFAQRRVDEAYRALVHNTQLPATQVQGHGSRAATSGTAKSRGDEVSRAYTKSVLERGVHGIGITADDLAPIALPPSRAQGGKESNRSAELRSIAPPARRVVIGSPGDNGRQVPRVLHMNWFHGKMPEISAQNMRDWVARAAEAGWTVRLWTDASANRRNRALFSSLAGMTGADGRPVVEVSTSPADALGIRDGARELHDFAAERQVWPMQSDIVRYHALVTHGGMHVDSDIGPGSIDLHRSPPSMDADSVPMLAPLLRDQDQERQVRQKVSELGRRTGTDAAELPTPAQYQWRLGDFNNNLIVAPPDSRFLNEMISGMALTDEIRGAVPRPLPQLEGTQAEQAKGVAAQFTGPGRMRSRLASHIEAQQSRSVDAKRRFGEFRKGNWTVDPRYTDYLSGVAWVTDDSADYDKYVATESGSGSDSGGGPERARGARAPDEGRRDPATSAASTSMAADTGRGGRAPRFLLQDPAPVRDDLPEFDPRQETEGGDEGQRNQVTAFTGSADLPRSVTEPTDAMTGSDRAYLDPEPIVGNSGPRRSVPLGPDDFAAAHEPAEAAPGPPTREEARDEPRDGNATEPTPLDTSGRTPPPDTEPQPSLADSWGGVLNPRPRTGPDGSGRGDARHPVAPSANGADTGGARNATEQAESSRTEGAPPVVVDPDPIRERADAEHERELARARKGKRPDPIAAERVEAEILETEAEQVRRKAEEKRNLADQAAILAAAAARDNAPAGSSSRVEDLENEAGVRKTEAEHAEQLAGLVGDRAEQARLRVEAAERAADASNGTVSGTPPRTPVAPEPSVSTVAPPVAPSGPSLQGAGGVGAGTRSGSPAPPVVPAPPAPPVVPTPPAPPAPPAPPVVPAPSAAAGVGAAARPVPPVVPPRPRPRRTAGAQSGSPAAPVSSTPPGTGPGITAPPTTAPQTTAPGRRLDYLLLSGQIDAPLLGPTADQIVDRIRRHFAGTDADPDGRITDGELSAIEQRVRADFARGFLPYFAPEGHTFTIQGRGGERTVTLQLSSEDDSWIPVPPPDPAPATEGPDSSPSVTTKSTAEQKTKVSRKGAVTSGATAGGGFSIVSYGLAPADSVIAGPLFTFAFGGTHNQRSTGYSVSDGATNKSEVALKGTPEEFRSGLRVRLTISPPPQPSASPRGPRSGLLGRGDPNSADVELAERETVMEAVVPNGLSMSVPGGLKDRNVTDAATDAPGEIVLPDPFDTGTRLVGTQRGQGSRVGSGHPLSVAPVNGLKGQIRQLLGIDQSHTSSLALERATTPSVLEESLSLLDRGPVPVAVVTDSRGKPRVVTMWSVPRVLRRVEDAPEKASFSRSRGGDKEAGLSAKRSSNLMLSVGFGAVVTLFEGVFRLNVPYFSAAYKLDAALNRGVSTGGSRTTKAHSDKVETYEVERVFYATLSGDATLMSSWGRSIEQIAVADARRMAGLDEPAPGTGTRRVPHFDHLSVDRPAHWAGTTPREVLHQDGSRYRTVPRTETSANVGATPAPRPTTVYEDYARAVLTGLAEEYPGLVVPDLAMVSKETYARRPSARPETGRTFRELPGLRRDYEQAIANTIMVLEAITPHRLEGRLEEWTGAGIDLHLIETVRVDPALANRGGLFRPPFVTVRLHAEPTGRRFGGTSTVGTGAAVAGSAGQTDGHERGHTLTEQTSIGFQGRDPAVDAAGQRKNMGIFNVVAKASQTRGRSQEHGVKGTTDSEVKTTGDTDVWHYDLDLTAKFGKFRKADDLLVIDDEGAAAARVRDGVVYDGHAITIQGPRARLEVESAAGRDVDPADTRTTVTAPPTTAGGTTGRPAAGAQTPTVGNASVPAGQGPPATASTAVGGTNAPVQGATTAANTAVVPAGTRSLSPAEAKAVVLGVGWLPTPHPLDNVPTAPETVAVPDLYRLGNGLLTNTIPGYQDFLRSSRGAHDYLRQLLSSPMLSGNVSQLLSRFGLRSSRMQVDTSILWRGLPTLVTRGVRGDFQLYDLMPTTTVDISSSGEVSIGAGSTHGGHSRSVALTARFRGNPNEEVPEGTDPAPDMNTAKKPTIVPGATWTPYSRSTTKSAAESVTVSRNTTVSPQGGSFPYAVDLAFDQAVEAKKDWKLALTVPGRSAKATYHGVHTEASRAEFGYIAETEAYAADLVDDGMWIDAAGDPVSAAQSGHDAPQPGWKPRPGFTGLGHRRQGPDPGRVVVALFRELAAKGEELTQISKEELTQTSREELLQRLGAHLTRGLDDATTRTVPIEVKVRPTNLIHASSPGKITVEVIRQRGEVERVGAKTDFTDTRSRTLDASDSEAKKKESGVGAEFSSAFRPSHEGDDLPKPQAPDHRPVSVPAGIGASHQRGVSTTQNTGDSITETAITTITGPYAVLDTQVSLRLHLKIEGRDDPIVAQARAGRIHELYPAPYLIGTDDTGAEALRAGVPRELDAPEQGLEPAVRQWIVDQHARVGALAPMPWLEALSVADDGAAVAMAGNIAAAMASGWRVPEQTSAPELSRAAGEYLVDKMGSRAENIPVALSGLLLAANFALAADGGMSLPNLFRDRVITFADLTWHLHAIPRAEGARLVDVSVDSAHGGSRQGAHKDETTVEHSAVNSGSANLRTVAAVPGDNWPLGRANNTQSTSASSAEGASKNHRTGNFDRPPVGSKRAYLVAVPTMWLVAAESPVARVGSMGFSHNQVGMAEVETEVLVSVDHDQARALGVLDGVEANKVLWDNLYTAQEAYGEAEKTYQEARRELRELWRGVQEARQSGDDDRLHDARAAHNTRRETVNGLYRESQRGGEVWNAVRATARESLKLTGLERSVHEARQSADAGRLHDAQTALETQRAEVDRLRAESWQDYTDWDNGRTKPAAAGETTTPPAAAPPAPTYPPPPVPAPTYPPPPVPAPTYPPPPVPGAAAPPPAPTYPPPPPPAPTYPPPPVPRAAAPPPAPAPVPPPPPPPAASPVRPGSAPSLQEIFDAALVSPPPTVAAPGMGTSPRSERGQQGEDRTPEDDRSPERDDRDR